MIKILFILLGIIILAVAVVFIYDARIITTKLFSFGDRNEGSAGLKIIGFIMVVIGLFIIYFTQL